MHFAVCCKDYLVEVLGLKTYNKSNYLPGFTVPLAKPKAYLHRFYDQQDTFFSFKFLMIIELSIFAAFETLVRLKARQDYCCDRGRRKCLIINQPCPLFLLNFDRVKSGKLFLQYNNELAKI